MAAPIASTATSLECQLFEAATALQEGELAVPEDTRPNRTSILYDLEDLEVTITVTLPVTISGSGDSATITAQPYLA